MKIVDVSGFYSDTGGGVRSYVRQKLDLGARHGHEVTIIAPGRESRIEARGGGKIVWVASPPMPFDDNYRLFWRGDEAWRAIDAERPDVVEGSSPWRGGWIAGTWPGEAVKALVFHQDFVAGYPHTLLDRWISRPRIDRLFDGYWAYARRLSARFDVTVAGGQWLADRLARFGLKNPVAAPFGIDRRGFSPAHRDEGLRRELLAACGASPQGRLLLVAGRFHPEKRHRTLLRGFALARARRPDLGMVIAGDGLIRGQVEREAARAGHCLLLGAVDRERLARLYASADALVHGSGAETYGLVVAEAIASGLPVVVPDSGGAADLAGRGVSQVYRTGDAADCAAAILTLLARLDGQGAGPPDDTTPPPDIESHFQGLFALYAQLDSRRRAAKE